MVLNDGLSLDTLSDRERSTLTSGMRSPRVVTLHAGDVVFRFASTQSPNESWAAGPWWATEMDYRKVISEHTRSQHEHGDDGFSLGYVGRTAFAVQPSWSKMDIVVKAIVLNDIKAFAGRGQRQHREVLPNGMHLTLSGWAEVDQIFIPGIGAWDGSMVQRTTLGFQALKVLRQKRISSDGQLGM